MIESMDRRARLLDARLTKGRSWRNWEGPRVSLARRAHHECATQSIALMLRSTALMVGADIGSATPREDG